MTTDAGMPVEDAGMSTDVGMPVEGAGVMAGGGMTAEVKPVRACGHFTRHSGLRRNLALLPAFLSVSAAVFAPEIGTETGQRGCGISPVGFVQTHWVVWPENWLSPQGRFRLAPE